MRVIINFVLVLSLLELIYGQLDNRDRRPNQCAFGEEYNDGCNHCICHGKSGSTCTKIPNCKITTMSPLKEFFAQRAGHCSLGREFQKDCNTCTCQGDLGYICTRKECVGSATKNEDFPLSPSSPSSSSSSKGKCVLGHRFFSGCDVCTCYGEHFGYRCSRMERCTSEKIITETKDKRPTIPESPTYRPIYDRAQDTQDNCPKGQNYFDGYHYCTCRNDHLGYVCKSAISN